jgi:shikimate dehydrogenase
VGTKGIDTSPPVTEDIIRRAKFVYDVVYNPPETGLLQAARSLGIPGASGLSMLLHQAAKSFELWMGRPAAFETMRRAAQEVLG